MKAKHAFQFQQLAEATNSIAPKASECTLFLKNNDA
jgi:hypothetical protein